MSNDRILRNMTLLSQGRSLPLQTQPARVESGESPAGISHADETRHIDRETIRELFAAELERAYSDARDEGRRQGLADAEQEIREQIEQRDRERNEQWQQRETALQEAINNFASAVTALDSRREQLLAAQQDAVISAVSAALLKILERFARDGSLVRRIARAQLKKELDKRALRIRVSPVDMLFIEKTVTDETPDIDISLFEVDDGLTPGDCQIDFESGTLDASLSLQLERFQAVLRRTHDTLYENKGSRG